MVKKYICFLLSVIIGVFIFSADAFAYTPSTFSISAEGCILASADNGSIIYEKNPDEKLFPASLTKIMTATVVLDECNDVQNTVATVPAEAIELLKGTDSSIIGLVEGEQLKIIDLLNMLLISSANDAANTLASYFGNGDINVFIDKMNKKATELGMKSTHYVNAHGLQDPEHYTTPRDMFTLTKYAIKNDTFKKIFGSARYRVEATNKSKARTLSTTVFLQDPNSQMPSAYYSKATGGKTGYTDDAGRCLISTATDKKGANYICVLMKSPVKDSSNRKVRYEFSDTKKLFEWAFSSFEYRKVYDTVTPIGECPVSLSNETDHVPLVLQRDVSAILPKDSDNSTVTVDIKLYNNPSPAPITKGKEMGLATIKYAGNVIDTVPVVSTIAANKSNLLVFVNLVTRFFSGKVVKVILLAIILLIVLFFAYTIWLNKKKTMRRRRKRRNFYN